MLCQEYECVENRREIERHHRDMQKISNIINRVAKDVKGLPPMLQTIELALALRDIRGIVG